MARPASRQRSARTQTALAAIVLPLLKQLGDAGATRSGEGEICREETEHIPTPPMSHPLIAAVSTAGISAAYACHRMTTCFRCLDFVYAKLTHMPTQYVHNLPYTHWQCNNQLHSSNNSDSSIKTRNNKTHTQTHTHKQQKSKSV